MVNKNNKFSHILSLLVFPSLFLSVLLVFGSVSARADWKWPSILGDTSERENNVDKNSEDGEKDTEDSNKESESENKDTEDKNDVENEEKDTKDSEDETDADEVEESKLGDTEKVEVISSTSNPDGTVTKVIKITDDDGDVVIKTVVYDQFGEVIDREHMEDEESSPEETREVISTSEPNADGSYTQVIKITDDEGEVEMQEVTYDVNGKIIKVEDLEDDGTKHVEMEEATDIEVEGSAPSKEMILNLKSKLLESGVGDSIKKLKVETDDGQVEIRAKLNKSERLFGIFKIEIPYQVLYDTGTDTIVQRIQSAWAKFLDTLSF
jgi:hypothetical protein